MKQRMNAPPTDAGPYDASRFRTEPLTPMRWLIVSAYLLVALLYLGWRATTLNPQAPIFSMVLYGAELFGFATTLLHLFMVGRLSIRKAPAVPAGATVDVFIPTYNEPTEMVRRTVLSARNIDYPHLTWLLDDGDRPEMAALANELGVRYLARGDNRHAKAGNLNHALQHARGEFIAIFDCDHAPKRNFLDETLGFFRDPKVAFVQTPQDFFNLDSYQHRRGTQATGTVWTEQSLFFRVIQRGKDAWNAAFFCGSCAVIRRSALDAIGGFGTHSITEDLETSVALHKAGFLSVYVPEPLAYGIAPSSASPFLRQRIRWGQGAMQIIRREWLFMRGRLSIAQRLNYLASTLTYFDGWQKAIFYLAPVWVLLSGSMPLVADAQRFLILFIPYFVLTFVVFEEVGRGYGRSGLIEQYNMARFAAFLWATVALLRGRLRFAVTAKDGLSARQTETRAVSPQIIVSVVNALAVIGGIALWLNFRHLPLDGLLANIVWASVNFLMAFLVVRFTLLRTRFKRKEYRFPVPLPATVEFGTRKALMTVDDISSSGCRIYGRFPDSLAVGETISGNIALPHGPLPFTAHVAALIPGGPDYARFTKAVGVAFEWADNALRDELDVFLYGSDLQWQMHALNERTRTPSETVADLLGRRHPQRLPLDNWSAVELGGDQPGLLSLGAPGKPRLLASFGRILATRSLIVREHTRTGEHRVDLTVGRTLSRLSTPTGDLYLTEVSVQPTEPPPARVAKDVSAHDAALPLAEPAVA
jgi:cellulose synthase (UDP-forming)